MGRAAAGAGLKTVIEAAPGLCKSAREIAACNSPLLMKVVVRSAPFQRTLATSLQPALYLPVTNRGPAVIGGARRLAASAKRPRAAR